MFFTIYKTTCCLTGKTYVGKHRTINLADGYVGSGKYLRRAIIKHGIENFVTEAIEIFSSEHEMNLAEKILVVPDRETSYNLCRGGQGDFSYINGSGISKFKGRKHSEETLRKLRLFNLGRKHSEETRIKISRQSRSLNLIKYVRRSKSGVRTT
jgi:group I intron endonuclease